MFAAVALVSAVCVCCVACGAVCCSFQCLHGACGSVIVLGLAIVLQGLMCWETGVEATREEDLSSLPARQ